MLKFCFPKICTGFCLFVFKRKRRWNENYLIIMKFKMMHISLCTSWPADDFVAKDGKPVIDTVGCPAFHQFVQLTKLRPKNGNSFKLFGCLEKWKNLFFKYIFWIFLQWSPQVKRLTWILFPQEHQRRLPLTRGCPPFCFLLCLRTHAGHYSICNIVYIDLQLRSPAYRRQ